MAALHTDGTAGGLSAHELDRDTAGIQQTYGLYSTAAAGAFAVTFSATLTFNVAAANAGDYIVNGVTGAAYAGGTVVLGAQDATNPRVDLVVTDSTGTVSVVAGTPAGAGTVYVAPTSAASPTQALATGGPFPTAPTAGQMVLARIYVPATGTPLSAASIIDRRTFIAVINPFDAIRSQFRANRRLVGEWSAQKATAAGTPDVSGTGFVMTGVDGSDVLTSLSGEPMQQFSVATAGTAYCYSVNLLLSPSHSPRLLARVKWPATNANVTNVNLGFFDANTATANGAYLRVLTTGDVFFVTRQGGAETTTDLGVLSRTVLLGYEIETVDAGVTWVCRNQAGTVLATSTTNVPTAATALLYGVAGVTAVGAVAWGASYLRVEGTFA